MASRRLKGFLHKEGRLRMGKGFRKQWMPRKRLPWWRSEGWKYFSIDSGSI